MNRPPRCSDRAPSTGDDLLVLSIGVGAAIFLSLITVILG